MVPLLSLHAIAAQRGDGLHPALLAGLTRVAAARVEPVAAKSVRAPKTRSAERAVERLEVETIAEPPRAG